MIENFKEEYYDFVLRSSFVSVIGDILAYIFPGHFSHTMIVNPLVDLILKVFVLLPIIILFIDYLEDYICDKLAGKIDK